MRRRIAVVSVVAAAAGLLAAGPAAATCMPIYHDPTNQVRIYSCSPPGGPVSTTYCVRDFCYTTTSGGGGGHS